MSSLWGITLHTGRRKCSRILGVALNCVRDGRALASALCVPVCGMLCCGACTAAVARVELVTPAVEPALMRTPQDCLRVSVINHPQGLAKLKEQHGDALQIVKLDLDDHASIKVCHFQAYELSDRAPRAHHRRSRLPLRVPL